MERERQRDLESNPEQYGHIWEGDFASVFAGSYYAKLIAAAKAEGRISRVGPDPLLSYRVFCDIGGTGQRADAFTMWVCQFVGRELRVLNYYEAVGQTASAHMLWLREKGYTGANSTIWLPHDGDTQDKVFDVSYRKAFESAGYVAEVVPNQGKGAAMLRVRSVQRVFPSIWINKETTEPGMEALGWYHEKKEPAYDLTVETDHCYFVLGNDGKSYLVSNSSHASDGLGIMCIVFETQGPAIALKPVPYRKIEYIA